MLKFKNFSFWAGFFFITSCIIVSEKDKCYEDIERGDKTAGFTDVCVMAGIYGSGSGTGIVGQVADYYLALCATELIEAEKCQGKSNWRPTIDARM
jgi:hypothetical protein